MRTEDYRKGLVRFNPNNKRFEVRMGSSTSYTPAHPLIGAKHFNTYVGWGLCTLRIYNLDCKLVIK